MGIRVYGEPELHDPSLLVGWTPDIGSLGSLVTDYLKRQTGARDFAEIEPLGFFPVAGVEISDDLIQFPVSRFSAAADGRLVILETPQPRAGAHAFLNHALDVAQKFAVREVFALGGLATGVSHTQPRRVSVVVNKPDLLQSLRDLAAVINYQGPPSTNSFLLWLAGGRGISGTTLWGEVPFYLAGAEDWRGAGAVLELLDKRLDLHLDLADLDYEARRQEAELTHLREHDAEVRDFFLRVEKNEELSQEEGQHLAADVARVLTRTLDSW